MKFVLVFLLFVFLIVTLPLLYIWAINTLFYFEIPYTLKTWFAMFLIGGMFSSGYVNKSG
jgi:hypothetical protein